MTTLDLRTGGARGGGNLAGAEATLSKDVSGVLIPVTAWERFLALVPAS